MSRRAILSVSTAVVTLLILAETARAQKINDDGWIVGSFGVVERGQAYLLKPVE